MKNIIKSLVVVVAVAAVAGGATYALFSDTETSVGNTFTAGTLDLELSSSESMPFTFSNIAPGWTKTFTYTLHNAGSLPGYVDFAAVNVVNAEGLNPESETNTAEPGDLGPNITVNVSLDGNPIFSGNLATFAGTDLDANFPLAAGANAVFSITTSLPSSVGNDVQGDIVTGDITFRLDQNM